MRFKNLNYDLKTETIIIVIYQSIIFFLMWWKWDLIVISSKHITYHA